MSATETKPVKYTVPFTKAFAAALNAAAKKAHTEPTEVIQRATINFLIDGGFIKEPDAERILLFWSLVDRAVAVARKRCREGKFASTITLDSFRVCMEDPAWLTDYKKIIKSEDPYRHGNPEKGPINREIGFRIRAAIGAVVDKDADGKNKTVKVLGEVIQSYTPMVSFDPEAVEDEE